MKDIYEIATVQLQIGLNKRMYEQKKIPYDIYTKANELLHTKLSTLQPGKYQKLDDYHCL